MATIESLETLLRQGHDSPLLRFSLGSEYLSSGDSERALAHLSRAIEQDSSYSAAWKLYGKALEAAGRMEDAARAFDSGIAIAREKGDIQAAKEMEVFHRRVVKRLSAGD